MGVEISNVEKLGFNFYRHKLGCIKMDETIGWVFVGQGSSWAWNDVSVDWFVRFNTFYNIKDFWMGVAENSCSDDMLESVHQSVISSLKWLNAVFLTRRMMSYYDCLFSISFHVSECFLKPVKFPRLISKFSKQVKVSKIALLKIHRKDSYTFHLFF